jgi:glycosyltransferase involved in cell wall biosynthesis
MRFSIVTPTYNMEKYLRETLDSVLSQEGDFELEYIIVDAQSTDNTISILEEYDQALKQGTYPVRCKKIHFQWISEKDEGMYDAINKGFKKATGDVYAWINADDLYEPGALKITAKIFDQFPDILWMKGITTNIEEDGSVVRKGIGRIYLQELLMRGVYGRQSYFVEQDSVFWRASLWAKIDHIPSSYKLAGDYWLWIRFAAFTPLWSINTPLSRFRKRSAQMSQSVTLYKNEQQNILPKTGYEFSLFRIFFSLQTRLSPHFASLFTKIYPALFMTRTKYMYLDTQSGEIIKKQASSYIIS